MAEIEYGSVPGIMAFIRSTSTGTVADDEKTRINQLHVLVRHLIESQTGAVFGKADPVQREVYGQGDAFLHLCPGVRSITGILEGPTTWSGTTWTDGTAVASTAYRLERYTDRWLDEDAASADRVYRQLRRTSGSWFGLYAITAVWEDQYATVPDDIHYVADRMAAEIFKSEKASPHGLSGPSGREVPVRNALSIPEIRERLEAYRVHGHVPPRWGGDDARA